MHDTILSILRHTLTFVGGLLVAQGLITDATVAQAVGPIVATAGALWGALDEYRAAKKQ
jgi:hypothetical protein